MTKILTITSGKGGVGKTNVCVNLSLQLAAQGYRTCIFDADLGLANINVLFGLYPDYTLEDIILKGKDLSEIIISDFQGIDIIPGSSGVDQIANSTSEDVERMITAFSMLDGYDYLLFDTSAGVSKDVVSFCLASTEIILVITPEPTSLTDAYALLKILCLNGMGRPVRVVINQCPSSQAAKKLYGSFRNVAVKNLDVDITPLGVVLADPNVANAVKKQKPFISLYPDTVASRCIKVMAKNLLEKKTDVLSGDNVESFMRRFINTVKGRLNLQGVVEEPVIEKEHVTAPAPSAHVPATEQALPEASITVIEPEREKPEAKQRADENRAAITEPVAGTAGGESAAGSRIDNIVESLSLICKEIKLLREAVVENGHRSSVPAGADNVLSGSRRIPLVLDFEKYVQKREKE